MKLKWIGSLLILAGVVGCKTPDRPNLVEYVNPNIGTVHSRWFFLHTGCGAFRFG